MTKTKSWISFEETKDTGKTKVWDVVNNDNGSWLGYVRWSGPWRQYVFEPAGECIWNPDCLDELSAFIRSQMEQRRVEAALRKIGKMHVHP